MKLQVTAPTLAVLVLAGFATHSRPAPACSPGDPADSYRTDATSADTTPPVLKDAHLSVRRADDPGDNSGGCEELGSYSITVEATDDQTQPADLGFALTLVDGSFPFSLPEDAVTDGDAGKLREWFVDEGEAFHGTLEVRVVDRAGNLSEPKRVSASGDEVGCTCSAAGAPSRGHAGFMGLAGLMLLVHRRRRRAVLCWLGRTPFL